MRQAGVLDLVVGARYLDTAAIDETVVCQDNNFVVMAGTVEAELVEVAVMVQPKCNNQHLSYVVVLSSACKYI